MEKVLSKFAKVKKTSDGYNVQCPCHDDKNPSLHISQKGDKILMHCHAGCDTEDILEMVGLKMKDLYLENTNSSNQVINQKIKKEIKKLSVLITNILTKMENFFTGKSGMSRKSFRFKDLKMANGFRG